MAACPKCGADLGLHTSFALANIWSPSGIGNFGFRLEFRCRLCSTKLTYRADVAGLFAILALLPMIVFPLLPSFGLSSGLAYMLWCVAIVSYWAGLAIFFSRYANPIVASPPLEGDW
jgi:hypothetical protein